MNIRQITGLVIILIMVTSGPLAIPLTLATTQPNENTTTQSNIYIAKNGTLLQPTTINIHPRPKKPTITLTTTKTNTTTPTPITLTCQVENNYTANGILQYKWDLNGDGKTDQVTTKENTITHIYNTNKHKKINTSVTVAFQDSTHLQATTQIELYPKNQNQWHEIKNTGETKIGIMKNSTIILFDHNNWIPLTYHETNTKLENPQYTSTHQDTRKLTYPLISGGTFNVTLIYGINGKTRIKYEEYTPTGTLATTNEKKVQLPQEKTQGNLRYKYKETQSTTQQTQENVFYDSLDTPFTNLGLCYITNPLLLLKPDYQLQLVSNGVPVFAEIGTHDPWNDQGLTPYGEYFTNNQEHVSTRTGALTLTATDLNTPGRGLDFAITRIYAPPVVYENDAPASSIDYSYQNYPWAPMGNGW